MSKQAPIGGLPAPRSPKLAGDHELVRLAHDSAIKQLQQLPCVSQRVIKDIVLPDNVHVVIPHGLGRVPEFVAPSAIRGASAAGIISEDRNSQYDRTRVVVLWAAFYGATITIDVMVM